MNILVLLIIFMVMMIGTLIMMWYCDHYYASMDMTNLPDDYLGPEDLFVEYRRRMHRNIIYTTVVCIAVVVLCILLIKTAF